MMRFMSELAVEPDGLAVFRNACEEAKLALPTLIERCCRWVAPGTFRALPVWYPEAYRGSPLCNKDWTRQYTNTRRLTGNTTEKFDSNTKANRALWAALGFSSSQKPKNWSVCHIWGVDDPDFQKNNDVVQDPRFFTCVANMVALPTPLKTFTDCLPEVKLILRVCAYRLYDWICEHESVKKQADQIRSGFIPPDYPATWPRSQAEPPPPGLVLCSARTRSLIESRKAKICEEISGAGPLYPRDRVQEVLRFWNVDLSA